MNASLKNTLLDSFEIPEQHPTAEFLYEKMKKERKDITREAIDSALKFLEKEGSVYSVVSTDKQKHFGKAKGMHAHFICIDCGKVRDIYIKEGALDMIRDHGTKLLGKIGKIDTTNISFQGQCGDCA